jgi:hypothetical protein
MATAAKDIDDARRLLHLYLQDHEAASVGGVRLAQRCHRSNRGTEFESALAELDTAIREDRSKLRAILRQIGTSPNRPKRVLAWCAATAGRLKLNGRLVSYSPLSRLVEIEALTAAVTAKLCLWNTLADPSIPDRRLDEGMILRLQQRAVSQLGLLTLLHRDAADVVFTNHSARSAT